ncbi:YdaU family protein [Paracraurococcus lichenis]|uniref:DUF1376 domain-containing protein n=1 Tax=Paracraurococcus lichenis TaxID=3064888 RepID=A0ABT9EDE5_9PROT|nr:DUF1376 domain-containing protein [Paracraurococcus sp. LOR1-02]MDO9714226.1 DUF1376 domain-containing protein [Paracraurococcus sp. LOR1-02]
MSGKVDKWMPLHIGDYLADTPHLSTTEHGAYFLLLMAHWRLGHLPDDDVMLARIANLRLDHWQKIARAIRAFFISGPEPGTLIQQRLIAEKDHAREVASKRAGAAAERWTRSKEAASKGGKSSSTTRGEAPRESITKHLKTKIDGNAKALGLQLGCTTQIQNHRDSSSLREEGGKPPRKVAGIPPPRDTLGAKVVPLPANPVEEAKGRIRAFLKQHQPRITEGRTFELCNSLLRAHCDGAPAPTVAVCDRVEALLARWLELRMAGMMSEALEPYLRGVIVQQRQHGEPEAPRQVANGPRVSRFGFAPIRQSAPQAPRAGGPVIDGIGEEIR